MVHHLKIIFCICALLCLDLLNADEKKVRLSISAGVSQAICISTAKFSTSRTIQGPQKDPSKFIANNLPKCPKLTWNHCESGNKCKKFECALSLSPTKDVGLTRIVGGTDALPNEFPHQILFLKKERPHCGGTLFNEKYIITAAHCFAGQVQSEFKVVAGDHNYTLKERTEQVSDIKRIIKHENYGGEGNSNSNDIALVEVDPPFSLNAQIQSALMPQLYFVATGDAIVTGWGTLDATYGGKPDILQKVAVPIVSNAECVDAYEPTYFEILPTMLCAGFLGKGGKDACHGDSGGPLVIKLDNGSYILVGVVSFGKNCADPHFPGVYTDVSKFVEWIYKNAI